MEVNESKSKEERLKEILEANPNGIALSIIMKELKGYSYYRVYSMLEKLGYKVIKKKIKIRRLSKFVIKSDIIRQQTLIGGNNNA